MVALPAHTHIIWSFPPTQLDERKFLECEQNQQETGTERM